MFQQSLADIPLKKNMVLPHLECQEKDGVNSSDWFYGCISIQLRLEGVLSAAVGTALFEMACESTGMN